jgi:hypothetical protein
MSGLISQVADWQQYLATTLVHPTLLPFPILDVLGAMRLSMVVDQISRAAASTGPGGAKRVRSTGLQEAFGILVVVFGGETFLGKETAYANLSLTSELVARTRHHHGF